MLRGIPALGLALAMFAVSAGAVEVEGFAAPEGAHPHDVAPARDGTVWYTVHIWSNSDGVLWVSEWNAGKLARFDPSAGEWREWPLPAENAAAYAVYVDGRDMVWVSDFGSNAVLRFDPAREDFEVFEVPREGAAVRQMLGREGEVWAAESGTDRLTVYRYD